jgi:hypothetical protein
MTEAQKAAFDGIRPGKPAAPRQTRRRQMDDASLTRWKYQRYIKNYLRTIRAMDENIGRLLDYLDESGLAENTIVIYSSDQGFYLGEHGWYDKRWMFEESFAMPFLIRWPGVVKPGVRSKALIQNIDYAPTFLEAAGVEVPPDIQGRSLVPILRNEGKAPADWRKALYYAYSGEGTHRVAAHDGVRNDRYKLFHLPDTGEWQLFDLEKDPQELRSLHDDPAPPARTPRRFPKSPTRARARTARSSFIECATDNSNRSVTNIKTIFNKNGGQLLNSGSLDFMFSRKSVIEFPAPEGKNLEEIELELIDAGLEEMSVDDGVVSVIGDYTAFAQLSQAVEALGITPPNPACNACPTSRSNSPRSRWWRWRPSWTSWRTMTTCRRCSRT